MALMNQRGKFSLEDDVAFLNSAYMTPLLKEVEAAGIKGVKFKQRPYQIKAADFFEQRERVKALFATVIDCDNPKNVACLPSVSYGIANVAKNVKLGAGSKIIMVKEQFPSNYYSWNKLAEEKGGTLQVVEAPNEPENIGYRWNQALLDSIDASTAVVALPVVHWSEGTVFDVAAIGKKCRLHGALLVIDGTQSIGALPFSVKEVRPDVLIAATYKWLMGPYSYALAYFNDEFCKGSPIEESWMNRRGSENFSQLVNYESSYKTGAERFSVGESSNFVLLPMVETALTQVLEWGVGNIQDYCVGLTTPLCAKLRKLGFRVEEDAFRAGHLFGIGLPKQLDPAKTVEALAANKIYVSQRGNALRVSVHLFNDANDVKRLLRCLEEELNATANG